MADFEIEVILWKNGRRIYEGHAGPFSADRLQDNGNVLVYRAEDVAYGDED